MVTAQPPADPSAPQRTPAPIAAPGRVGELPEDAIEAAAKAVARAFGWPGEAITDEHIQRYARYADAAVAAAVPHIERQLRAKIAAEEAQFKPLFAAEEIALTVALAQVERGEQPTPNVTAVCVYALARVAQATSNMVDSVQQGLHHRQLRPGNQ